MPRADNAPRSAERCQVAQGALAGILDGIRRDWLPGAPAQEQSPFWWSAFCQTELSYVAWLGTPPAGEIVGAAHVNQPRPVEASPKQAPGRIRPARPGLRLVQRGVRHQGFAGREVASCRTDPLQS